MNIPPPPWHREPQAVGAPGPAAGQDDFLVRLDEKLRQRNDRLTGTLLAWGELLDAAGWCVALEGTAGDLWMSGHAQRDLQRTGGVPTTWAEVAGRISVAALHRAGEGVMIWAGHPVVAATPEPGGTLTRRESEVMGWLREGKTAPEIAIILGCATRTVEKHLANLYRKIGVKNRAAVILKVSNPIH